MYNQPELTEELISFWEARRTQEVEDKINNAVSKIVTETKSLSDESKQEIVSNWTVEAESLASTAVFYRSMALQADTESDAEEWNYCATRCLVAYHMITKCIARIRATNDSIKEPPKREHGESAEEYKARLLRYADTIT